LWAQPSPPGFAGAQGKCSAAATTVGAQNRPSPETVLFIGNSFLFGAGSPVRFYRPETVVDLNGSKQGGVPALFKLFRDEAGLDFAVSLETVGGQQPVASPQHQERN